MRNRKAYTLIEVLLVLLFIPLALSLVVSMLRLISEYDYHFNERQNFIAIIQLRKRVALGSSISLNDDRLLMTYQNRDIELICEDTKLTEREGYMEYLTHIEGCAWEIKEGLVYLVYEFNQWPYRIYIGYDA